MLETTPHAVFEAMSRAVRERDFDAFLELFDETGVIEYPFPHPAMPPRLDGRRAIRDALGPMWQQAEQSGRLVSGYDNVKLHPCTDPDLLIAEFDMYGEARGSGAAYRLSYLHVVHLQNGKIRLFRDYFNPAAFASLPR